MISSILTYLIKAFQKVWVLKKINKSFSFKCMSTVDKRFQT